MILIKLNDERLQLYVLQIVKYNIELSDVVGANFTYQDIIEISNILKINGMLSSLEGDLKITPNGDDLYKSLLLKTGVKEKGPLILPQYKYLNSKIDKYEVYLREKDIPR